MPIKVENFSTVKLRFDPDRVVNSIFDTVPKEHIRGISKVVIVDYLQEKAVPKEIREKQPGLYHPRMAGSSAWLEVALSPLIPNQSFMKRFAAKVNLKSSLATILLQLIGQHYHMTLSHGIKKHQYEQAVRGYSEKYYVAWRNQNAGKWTQFLKPLHPYLDRFGKWLSKHYQQQLRKQKQTSQATAAKARKK